MRRSRERGQRVVRRGAPFYTDPFVNLEFTRAWRADDALDDGSVTDEVPNYLGASLPLLPQGTGQAIKAASANLGGHLTITCDGQVASSGYSEVIAAAPVELTVISVVYLGTAVVSGLMGLTVGGTVNTGVAQTRNTTLRSVKLASDVASAISPPVPVILGSVYTATTVRHYATRYTAVSGSIAGALAGTTIHAMCRAANASVPSPMTGEWATMGYALRALTAGEMAFALRMLGRKYDVAIAA